MKANEIVKFEVGNIYQMRFIGDSELVLKWICIKITEKTASFKQIKLPFNGVVCENDIITRRIKNNSNNVNYIVDGKYSMAPSIHANNVVG